VERIQLADDRIQWHTFMRTVMKLWVPYKVGNLLTATTSFPKTLLHGIMQANVTEFISSFILFQLHKYIIWHTFNN